jgi:hypothetical protein
MKRLIVGCVTAVSISLASTAASACGAGAVLFEDNFNTLEPTWGFAEKDETRSNGPGGLSYNLKVGNSLTLLNNAGTYDDYEACGKFKVGKIGEDSASFSVIFWGVDNKNYYGASVSPR